MQTDWQCPLCLYRSENRNGLGHDSLHDTCVPARAGKPQHTLKGGKKMRAILTLVAALTGLALVCGGAVALTFTDDFEAGMGNWSAATGVVDWVTTQNKVPDGSGHSAYCDLSLDRVYHDLGVEADGWFKFGVWIYDDTMTRTYAQVCGYSGSGYNLASPGSAQQLFAIGKYNSNTAPYVYDATKYQARVLYSNGPDAAGWFNLPGSVRSVGWHKFEVERLANTDVNFYFDGGLSRTFVGAKYFSMDSLTLGFGTTSTSNGNTWYDGVEFVPEPGSLLALGTGLIALVGIRRRRA